MHINLDEVGITKPLTTVDNNNIFPSCSGNSKIMTGKEIHKGGESTTIYSSKTRDGWRVLRFYKRVGYGKNCYRKVKDSALNWDFIAYRGKKSMGIISSAVEKNSWLARRSLLGTFTEIYLPKPFKSLFVVNPVHVVYEVNDDKRRIPNCIFSSTAYATMSGHLLAGEERVTVVWRKETGEVDVEIASFSRSAPSFAGACVWPLIGRMQKQFFLAELNHLAKVAKRYC